MTEEQVVIVNENDEVIGSAPRSVMRKENLLHRSSPIFVFNSENGILVHQRSHSKDLYPGYFDFLARGVIDDGETAEQNARREANEEVGITQETPLKFLFKTRCTTKQNNAFLYVFECIYDGQIKPQEEEVIQGKFVSMKELQKLMSKEKFVPDSRNILEKYRAIYKKL